MGSALFQVRPVPCDERAVATALADLPACAGWDVGKLVARANGVLADGLSLDQATAAAERLAAAGLSVEVGSDRWLHLPEPIRCRAVRRADSDLVLVDAHGNEHVLIAGDLVLLASGEVAEPQLGDPDAAGRSPGLVHSAPTGQVGTTVLELFAANPVRRFAMRADQFNYRVLGGDVAISSGRNFVRLLQMLAAWAPAARHNRGAAAVLGGLSNVSYPDREAFQRESSCHLFGAHAGDETRYPMPDAPTPSGQGLSAEVRAAVLALESGSLERPVQRRRRRLMWLVVQVLILIGLAFWFSSTIARLRLPSLAY